MKIFIYIFVLFSATCLYSTIINIPADQPTIQAGIDAAVDADTVLVQPGTYFENINFNGKAITVASLFLTTQDTTYISQTVIDGSQPINTHFGSCVMFNSGEGNNSILSGFSLINGSGYCYYYGGHSLDWNGGGVYCVNSSPVLKFLKIIGLC